MDQPIKLSNQPIPRELIILQTQYSCVLLHPSPFLKNHLIIVPLISKKTITHLSDEEGKDIMLLIKKVMSKLKDENQGFTVYIRENNKQFYVHLVPRNFNDLKINQTIYDDNSLIHPSFEGLNEGILQNAVELRRLIND